MKKNLSTLIVICCVMFTLHAQTPTFVSTTPSNKNVVLEEFTGKGCQYCPDGHRIGNELAANNPNKVFLINIHTGPYANGTPNYTTIFGAALANQTGISGYPAGTVNRHIFPNLNENTNKTILNRSKWASAANTILGQTSYVNVAAQSTIDFDTRILTVNVEIYYTGNSPATITTNRLNVALLQDNILGPQTGMAANPTQVIGGQYNHQHMLRHLLTGQWGDTITTTTQGSFVTKQYTYTIPAHLNNITYELPDLEVIVFIAEGQQEIITGAKSSMAYVNSKPDMPRSKESETYNCENVRMEHTIRNLWNEQNITSLGFEYTYGGTTYPYEWEGNIAAGTTGTVLSPVFPIVSGISLAVTARLVTVNGGEAPVQSSSALTFRKTVYKVSSNPVIFKFVTDKYASESSYKFFNDNGAVIKSEGPWADANDTISRIIELRFTSEGCYKLEVYDEYGDGINSSQYGRGYLEILDTAGHRIAYNNGQFGAQANFYFNYEIPLYNITVSANPAEAGTVEGGVTDILHGTSVTVKAEANEGYNFVNWMRGTTLMSTDAEYTFTAIRNADLVANFVEAGKYLITYEVIGQGGEFSVKANDVAFTNREVVDAGTEITITASAAPNYKIYVTVNGTELPSTPTVSPVESRINVESHTHIICRFVNTTGIAANTLDNVKVYSHLNHVYIVNENNIRFKSVQLIDLLGRIIYNGNANNSTMFSVDAVSGLYIVRLISEEGKVSTTKVYLQGKN